MFGEGLIWAATSLKGRLSQVTAFVTALCITLVSAAAVILYYYAILDYLPPGGGAELVQTIIAQTLPTGWLLLSVNVKRLHDFGFSGWWALVGLMPGIGFLIWLVYLVPGAEGENRFGKTSDSIV